MKFTGQVRFPDIDHPGIPAAFHVEDKQAELMLEGESLGRWSLFDVHARRLVSSAFEVSLKGEEITFVADKPMDFAYRGIEHMAEVWAGFKSRGFISRLFSVKWSRRGTLPSRLAELQRAMLENLSQGEAAAPRRVGGLPGEPVTQTPEPVVSTHQPVVPAHPPPTTPAADTAGIDAVQVERAALEAERARIEADRQRLEAERAAAEREVADSIAAARAEIEKLEAHRAEAKGEATPAVEEQYAPEEPAAEPQAMKPEPAEHAEKGDLVKEVIPTSAEPESEDQARELVVDLGELETAEPEPSGEQEPALAVAAPKSGLMGAVKAAFSKNSGRQHVHEFVEAPAGIGIVRSICSECGYVSISTSD